MIDHSKASTKQENCNGLSFSEKKIEKKSNVVLNSSTIEDRKEGEIEKGSSYIEDREI